MITFYFKQISRVCLEEINEKFKILKYVYAREVQNWHTNGKTKSQRTNETVVLGSLFTFGFFSSVVYGVFLLHSRKLDIVNDIWI